MHNWLLYTKIIITGGVILGLQLASSRIMTPFFGVNIHIWASILSVTLIALALGYKIGGILTNFWDKDGRLLAFITAGAAASLWVTITCWSYPFVFSALTGLDLILGSIVACFYMIFIPLILLSALNPILVAVLQDNLEAARQAGVANPLGKEDASSNDYGAGTVLFISTLGSVLGVFVVAYFMLPNITNYQTFVILSFVLALTTIMLHLILKTGRQHGYNKSLVFGILCATFALVTFASGGLEKQTFFAKSVDSKGKELSWHTIDHVPSFFDSFKVIDVHDKKGPHSRFLMQDGLLQNKFMISDNFPSLPPNSSSSLYTYILESLALATAKDPKHALVLGAGAGVVPMTFAERGIEVDSVDISREIVEVSREHLWFDPNRFNTNINLHYKDARIAAKECAMAGRSDSGRDGKLYDIIIVDLFRGDGIPEHLVTQEFFLDLFACMTPEGVIVMNSFTHEEYDEAHHALLKTIHSVFGEIYAVYKTGQEGFLSAYFMGRKAKVIEGLGMDLSSIPYYLRLKFHDALESATIYDEWSTEIEDADIITDVSNNWRQLIQPVESAYRKIVVKTAPWQVLMN